MQCTLCNVSLSVSFYNSFYLKYILISGLAVHAEPRSSYKVGSQCVVLCQKQDTRDNSECLRATGYIFLVLCYSLFLTSIKTYPLKVYEVIVEMSSYPFHDVFMSGRFQKALVCAAHWCFSISF